MVRRTPPKRSARSYGREEKPSEPHRDALKSAGKGLPVMTPAVTIDELYIEIKKIQETAVRREDLGDVRHGL